MLVRDRNETDGVWKAEYRHQGHEEKLYRRLTQPNKNLIYERNKRLRNELAVKDFSFGRYVGEIPLEDLEKASRADPDLKSPDGKIRQKALMRFLKSPEGQACLVVPRNKL